MNERFRYCLWLFLALRAAIDLAVAAIIYRWVGSLIASFGFLALCCVFYVFLSFGIRYEEFRGRYGSRVKLWREPVGFWFCFAFLVLCHLIITGGAVIALVKG